MADSPRSMSSRSTPDETVMLADQGSKSRISASRRHSQKFNDVPLVFGSSTASFIAIR